MEQINMQTMQIVDDLARMRSFRKANADKQPDTDPYGFKYEPFEAFSAEPLGFLETAMRLQTGALELFGAMGTANRHSPLYIRMCSQMEKLIAQLGSCCITKAVIEHEEGEKFGFLTDLTIKRLRKITGFNFRKCYQSFMESQTLGHFNAATLNLSVRWAALDKRLIATEEKIEKINAGKLKVSLSEDKEPVKADPEETQPTEEKHEPGSFRNKGTSFAVDKSAVKQATGKDLTIAAPGNSSEPNPSAETTKSAEELITEEDQPSAGKENPDRMDTERNPETPVRQQEGIQPMTGEIPEPEKSAEEVLLPNPETTDPEETVLHPQDFFPGEEEIPSDSVMLLEEMMDFCRANGYFEWAPP